MHQLLLLRHAKSSRDDPRLPDRERPLSSRGRRDAAAMRRTMQSLGLAPDVVLVSPSRRTLQTLEALEPWDDTPLTETLEELYLAEAGQILKVLSGLSETVRSVLVVAHNPGMHDLVQQLCNTGTGAEPFPTCTLAEFMLQGQWRDLPIGVRLIRKVGPDHTLP